jgi:redox-sensitive bicupin YhaK (pirin superfamily)
MYPISRHSLKVFAIAAWCLILLTGESAFGQVLIGEAAIGSWHDDKPGVRRLLTPQDLPAVAGKRAAFSVGKGRTIAVVVLHGAVRLDDGRILRDAQMAVLEPAGEDFGVAAHSDAILLVLSVEPLDEPIVGYGPFVMNTREQISEAIDDFNSGRFGQVPQRQRPIQP